MGGFHILMNYMAALGKMVKSSGLAQVLVHSDIYSEVTVKQVLCGKHYNRGVWAHKILYEAISRQKLKFLSEWLQENDQFDPLDSHNISIDDNLREWTTVADKVATAIKKFDSDTKLKSNLSMFWNSYLHAVEAMLGFIRAERSGNWQLYLDSMQAMLPVFSAYDRTNLQGGCLYTLLIC